MGIAIVGTIEEIETIATGSGIREVAPLRRTYGHGRWRKRRGFALVRLPSGGVRRAELF